MNIKKEISLPSESDESSDIHFKNGFKKRKSFQNHKSRNISDDIMNQMIDDTITSSYFANLLRTTRDVPIGVKSRLYVTTASGSTTFKSILDRVSKLRSKLSKTRVKSKLLSFTKAAKRIKSIQPYSYIPKYIPSSYSLENKRDISNFINNYESSMPSSFRRKANTNIFDGYEHSLYSYIKKGNSSLFSSFEKPNSNFEFKHLDSSNYTFVKKPKIIEHLQKNYKFKKNKKIKLSVNLKEDINEYNAKYDKNKDEKEDNIDMNIKFIKDIKFNNMVKKCLVDADFNYEDINNEPISLENKINYAKDVNKPIIFKNLLSQKIKSNKGDKSKNMSELEKETFRSKQLLSALALKKPITLFEINNEQSKIEKEKILQELTKKETFKKMIKVAKEDEYKRIMLDSNYKKDVYNVQIVAPKDEGTSYFNNKIIKILQNSKKPKSKNKK